MYSALRQDQDEEAKSKTEHITELTCLDPDDRGSGRMSSCSLMGTPIAKISVALKDDVQGPTFDSVLSTITNAHARPRRRFQGAVFTTWLFFWALCGILSVNCCLLVYALVKVGDLGVSTILTGSPMLVTIANIVVHLFINILGSVLLAASTFAMHCLSSPTRFDLDCAHAKGISLFIGLLSFRNLRHLSRQRTFLWCLLAVTSLPIHLMYNPTFFVSSYYRDGAIMAVGSKLAATASDNIGAWKGVLDESPNAAANFTLRDNALRNITALECLEYTSRGYAYQADNLIAVTQEDPIDNGSGIWWADRSPEDAMNFFITCNRTCEPTTFCDGAPDKEVNLRPTLSEPPTSANSFGLENIVVTYCLVQEIQNSMSLQVAAPFLAVVVLCNISKLLAIGLTLRRSRGVLLATGDALASFLERPDSHTSKIKPLYPAVRSTADRMPSKLKRRSLWETLGTPLIGGTFFVGTVTYSLCVTMIVRQIEHMEEELRLTWDYFDSQAIFDFPVNAILPGLLLVNLPQLALTLQHFLVCRSYAVMQNAWELSQFAVSAQPLRVTAASTSIYGRQNSTYWLSVPFRCSLPLMVTSIAMHWILSQSLSVQSQRFYHPTGDSFQAILWVSPTRLVIFALIGAALTLSTLCYSLLKLPSAMPLMNNSSLVLAAACHPPEDDTDAHLKKVRWGDASTPDSEIGRCTFTSHEVRPLQSNRLYDAAGFVDIAGRKSESEVIYWESDPRNVFERVRARFTGSSST